MIIKHYKTNETSLLITCSLMRYQFFVMYLSMSSFLILCFNKVRYSSWQQYKCVENVQVKKKNEVIDHNFYR